MHNNRTRRQLVVAVLLLGSLAQAQVTTPTPTTASSDPNAAEETVVLSPFVVNADSTMGYVATSTLAGTRLRTKLNEVGAAISVVTEEMMNDLGATGPESLLTYTTGTEIGGTFGNFAGGSSTSARGNGRANQDGARSDPSDNQRVRGLASAEQTRNYFLTDIPFDSYNTEAVTINRGPNSLLFGIGSPGGVIESSTKQAKYRNFTEIGTRIDNQGSHRVTLDINRELVDDRLAVRVIGLHGTTNFQQKPAFQDDRRLYAAFEATVSKNSGSNILGPTLLRGNFESVKSNSNPPNVVPPNDAFSTFWDIPTDVSSIVTNGTIPAWFNDDTYRSTTSTFATGFLDGYRSGLGFAENVGPVRATPAFKQIMLYYSNPGNVPSVPGAAFVGGVGNYQWGSPRPAGVAASTFFYTTRAWPGHAFIVGYNTPVVQDRNIFDYRNNLYSGDLGRVDREGTVGTVTLEQSFLDNLAWFEATYDRQRFDHDAFLPFSGSASVFAGGADILIDITHTFPDGTPNPNAGRPLSREQGPRDSSNETDRDSFRSTLTFNLEGKRFFKSERSSWLFGRHVLTGMYQTQTVDTRGRNYAWGWTTTDAGLNAYIPQSINSFEKILTPTAYVGPSVGTGPGNFIDGPSGLRIQPVNIAWPHDGEQFLVHYLDTRAPLPAEPQLATITARRFLNSGGLGRSKIDSRVASLQSYLLGDHIVGLLGVRNDTQRIWNNVDLDNDADPTTFNRIQSGELRGALAPEFFRLRDQFQEDSGDTTTWSLVGLFPEKLLFELPFDVDLRAFYNRSENFNPVGLRRDVLGQVLDSPAAETTEYGVFVDIGNRVSVRFNIFETLGKNFTYPGLNTGFMFSRLYVGPQAFESVRASGGTLQSTGLAAAGYATFEEFYDDVWDALTPDVRSVLNPRLETIAGSRVVVVDPIVGLSSTSDFLAKGFELDVVANPVKGLRIAFNLAKQETVQSNVITEAFNLAQSIFSNIDQSRFRNVADRPDLQEGVTFWDRYNSAVMPAFNGAKSNEGRVSLEQRKWRANLVANYEFGESWLRGFGVGGALRYQSRQALGYPGMLTSDRQVVPNLDSPFWGKDEMRGDIWVSYKRKLKKDKIGWKAQINIRDAFGSRSDIPVLVNPNGETAIIRIPPPTTVFFSNTFSF